MNARIYGVNKSAPNARADKSARRWADREARKKQKASEGLFKNVLREKMEAEKWKL